MKMKKFVALLLATLMVFSLFAVNTAVFAEEPVYDAEVLGADGIKVDDLNLSDLCSWNDSAAKMAAWDGYTIKLLKDVKLTSEVFLVGNITIDGNGFKLTSAGRLFNFATDATQLGDNLNNNNEMTFKTLTIKNLKAVAKEIVVPYYGKVVLEEGNDMISRSGLMFTCFVNNGAHYVFNGGTYTASGENARILTTGFVVGNAASNTAKGMVYDICGGKYVSQSNAIIARLHTACTVNIRGGEFVEEYKKNVILEIATDDPDFLVNIYDGYFHSESENRVMAILGGTVNFYNGIVENTARGNGDLFTVRNNAILNIYGGRILNVDGKDDIQIVSPGVVTRHDGYDALPQTWKGASVRLVVGSEGIRFESQIPAALVALAEDLADKGTEVSYGTLIVPTDTIAEQAYLNMNTLRMLGLKEGKDYVDIVAKDGMTVDEKGNVNLRAALVNIRETNYDLALSAVSYIRYIKDGHEVTVCSDYVAGDHSRSMSFVAQKALEDLKDVANDEYRYPVNGKYSPYTDEQREALKVYLGLDA